MNEHQVLIIGGGLAGLTAAIHLVMEGLDVAVFEQQTYPHHKVCGEYVSKEITPYLEQLGIDLKSVGAVDINQFQISNVEGYAVHTDLPLGGWGISRYAFDQLLYHRAKALGVRFYFEKVNQVDYQNDLFKIFANNSTYTSKVVLGAYGKRSILDKKMERDFSMKKQAWLAVKMHYRYPEFPEHLVGLHNFEGGYAGLSKTESGAVNFCYLAYYPSFKKYRDIEVFNNEVAAQNPFLRTFLSVAQPIFDQPMTIAQISFDKKDVVVNHVLMCGDTAGLIHPLCGNGMAMAIHSAKIASELVLRFLQNENYSRQNLEKDYRKAWVKTFGKRLWFGRKLQGILLNKSLVSVGIRSIGKSSWLLKYIISRTHGKLIS